METNEAIIDFESEPIFKLLLKYSLPAMLALIAMAAYESADRFFVGRYVGDAGLAAMGAGLPFVLLMNAVCLMVRVGATSFLTRTMGAGDINDTNKGKLLSGIFVVFIIFGILMLLIGTVFAVPIVKLCGATSDILDASVGYIRIVSLGAPFLLVAFGANSLMRATGSPKKGLVLICLSAGTNIALDAFTVGYLGLGLHAAAYSTVVSQAVGAVYGLVHFLSANNSGVKLRGFAFNFVVFKEIISVGFAYAVFEIGFILTAAISLNMLSIYGGSSSLAQIAIINSVVAFLYTPLLGLDEGLQPIIGYNYGAGNKQRVKKAVLLAFGIGGAFLSVTFVIIHFWAEYIVAIFITDAPGFIQMAARALRITFIAAPLMSVMLIVPGVLSALGEVRYNIMLSVGIQICLQIPLLFILPLIFGVDGVWFSYPTVDMISMIFGLYFLYKAFKRHMLLS